MRKNIERRMSLSFCIVGLVLVFITSGAGAEDSTFDVQLVAGGLEHPWGMAFLPDGNMLVSQRGGQLRWVGRDGDIDTVSGLPDIRERGQGGLMGLAVHPDFAQNQWLYLSYAGRGVGGYSTEVLRGRYADKRLTDIETIFQARPKRRGGRHFGGKLLFDDQGYLFISLGDRGERPDAQDLRLHSGSLIRLHADGGVPEDNPFGDRENVAPGIYTIGNRNMQGMALHPRTGEVWTHEHGPQGGDEINIMRAGLNYGWPIITYGKNYGIGTKIGVGTHKAGMEQPIYKWVPSIAPSGMAFYQGDKFPAWQGNLFVGSLKFDLLVRLELDGEDIVREERLLEGRYGRIRDVTAGPDGYLYVLSDARDGQLLRLVPKS